MKFETLLTTSLILFTLLFVGCNRLIEKNKDKAQSVNRADREIQHSPNSALFHFAKSSCFGKCPQYEIMIFGDGRIHYKGIKNVDRVGDFNQKLDSENLNNLISAFQSQGFLEMEPSYVLDIQDLSKTHLTFQNKTIVFHQRSAPKELREMEKLITHFKDNLAW